MLSAEAWKVGKTKEDGCLYRLQVSKITDKSRNKLSKVVEGWRECGEVHHKNGQLDLLYSCSFSDETQWIRWAKQFPYELVEISASNKPKPIKLGAAAQESKNGKRAKKKTNSSKSRTKRSKVTCSNCGKKGHNSRSCPNPAQQKKATSKKKKVAKKLNTCKNCGGKGHNSRTCKSKPAK